MTTKTDAVSGLTNAVKVSWLPMIVIALAQIQMGFNVSALPVSIGGIVEDFDTSPSSVSTALGRLLAGGGRVRHAGRQARQSDRLPGGVSDRRDPARVGDGRDGGQQQY